MDTVSREQAGSSGDISIGSTDYWFETGELDQQRVDSIRRKGRWVGGTGHTTSQATPSLSLPQKRTMGTWGGRLID